MREVRHEEGHTWERTSVVDEEAIDHERIIAMVNATGETVQVRVAQRKDFDLLVDPVTVIVSPPRITVGAYIEMSGPQCTELGGELLAAGHFADKVAGFDGSERPVEVVQIDTRGRRPRLVGDA
jgi:hypothetical protein